jgi:hypothetical protein
MRSILHAVGLALAATSLAQAQQWVDLNISGPSPRWQTAATLIPPRNVVVLFGGLSPSGTRLNDTWEFDGTSWTQRMTTSSPPALSGHAMAYEPQIFQVRLAGGTRDSGGLMPESYVYNGATWNLGGFVWSPGSRLQPVMLLDASPARNQAVLYGGFNDPSRFTDLWGSSPAWGLRASGGGGSRQGHVGFYDSVIGFPVFYGGADPLFSFQTVIWRGSSSFEFGVATPGPRYLAAAAFDESRGKGIMFGGNTSPWTTTTPVTTETWEWTGVLQTNGVPTGSWARVATNGPASAQGAVMFYLPSTGRIYLFGGADAAAATVSGRTYIWSTAPACYANCDGSTTAPTLNVNDFTCFLNRYASGDSYANCDASTTVPVLNVNDFVCFQQRFAAGCP